MPNSPEDRTPWVPVEKGSVPLEQYQPQPEREQRPAEDSESDSD